MADSTVVVGCWEILKQLAKKHAESITPSTRQADLSIPLIEEDLMKESVFRAARKGNSEFMTTSLRSHPHLANEVDDNNHTLFHVAVQHRHLNVCNMLIQMMGHEFIDRERNNNILQLAAKLPLSGLELVPGPALQLHHELLFFEEMKKVFGLEHITQSCMQLFEEQHEKLRRKGEKWLIKIADSCMLVAILLTILSLLACFSAASGNEQHTRTPILLDNFWFKTFAASNSITLTFSASSVLFFLSILTSTFSMNEFRISLPFKLLLGLFSLSTSILLMLVGCFAAFFGISKHHALQYPYPVTVVASIPVLFLAHLYLPLFYSVFHSTLNPFLQFRRNRFY